ncbi:MAG: vitamin B12-dependent ribonucleotide reductase [Bacteroidota bacterium]|nr:vitamin B12-dependent ribonucleotide reductase [Bacteroidota bacterium]
MKKEKKTSIKNKKGLTIQRRYTSATNDVYKQFEYELRSSVIRNPSGEEIFRMDDVEVPSGWSQVATDILAQKYFRKTGVPEGTGSHGCENSIQQVVHRMAATWTHWGESYGYFKSKKDGKAFYDELVFMLLSQMAAPNSPQWFNTGLYHVYGIKGQAQGHYYVDPETGKMKRSTSAYIRPQPHACFILSVDDDLVNKGGIMDLWIREARIFKYGSGTGANFSKIRGADENLAGGGKSSGLMSFLKIGDRAAGAIKSGGTTRRAAKMVCLDMDHPEIEAFINWKVEEEKKVAALIRAGYAPDYEGEAYQTVSGQNSNNSVRVPNAFFRALNAKGDWDLIARTDGSVIKTIPAKKLWDDIASAAWNCADPGVQFDTTINEWHTCPKGGTINASNPCSEYMFLDNTACNLASLNLSKFFDASNKSIDVASLKHASRLWTIVLEISVLMAQFPSKEVAQLSFDYRTLGLGYANLGSVLMVAGLPYDCEESRGIAAAITAIMTGTAYKTSAELASVLGAFTEYSRNKKHMLRVIRNHRYAAYHAKDAFEKLEIIPACIDANKCPDYLLKAAGTSWDEALQWGEQYGYRNAQVSCIAPTGTIGLIMDCDTTGVEPDFALVKFKKLSGGGYFRIVNQSVPVTLKNLGYDSAQVKNILQFIVGTATFSGAPIVNHETLKSMGFLKADLEKLEKGAAAAFDIRFLFNYYNLGTACMDRLGFKPTQYESFNFNLLAELGFSEAQIEEANQHVCGTMTIEGAPGLKMEHLPVFDCANKCGKEGRRFIHPFGHIKMMAAVQPFLSGAISKTINLPHEATIDDVRHCYELSWMLGLKSNALYRDGSKLSQPLSNKSSSGFSSDNELTADQVLDAAKKIIQISSDTNFERQLSSIVHRKMLPSKREGFTQKGKIGGHTILVRTGEYDDGTLRELFIDMNNEGESFRSLLNCFAISVSIGLQYGVPLEEFVEKFVFSRFEPSGQVDHPYIKTSTSVVDYIFRLLALEYLGREDLANVKPAAVDQKKQMPGSRITEKQEQNEQVDPSQQYLERTMGDAPFCYTCGHITVRSGSCYKCINCGTSLGCS